MPRPTTPASSTTNQPPLSKYRLASGRFGGPELPDTVACHALTQGDVTYLIGGGNAPNSFGAVQEPASHRSTCTWLYLQDPVQDESGDGFALALDCGAVNRADGQPLDIGVPGATYAAADNLGSFIQGPCLVEVQPMPRGSADKRQLAGEELKAVYAKLADQPTPFI
ncbi:MAG TPA: hypothetical protein VLI05_00705 [Candidatus Saccharimonadia bacterium]|nr:hypothetical protein [Candidatus Saccharimonadia bacterium]